MNATEQQYTMKPRLVWRAEHPFLHHDGSAACYELRRHCFQLESGYLRQDWIACFNGEPIGSGRMFQHEAEQDCERHLLGTLAVNPLPEAK